MEFLHSFLRHHFSGKPVVVLENFSCFLRLVNDVSFLRDIMHGSIFAFHCFSSNSPVVGAVGPTSLELFPAPQLTCGTPVNETFYDHLEGIANREYHPTFVEPDVALIFKKNDVEDIDLGLIESNLKRAIEEVG